ncbi:hypothetical protein PoB_000336700 [Plakobranchus ocellatus]|uniref:Secreted protein n=1 Tax=Plakobranchus ocellatus TaxID=259542 RepID=A0AAV3Y2C0_9GAST|nr:hypothetical protein PoB_000336700 [Plakobranchus ocellatus]
MISSNSSSSSSSSGGGGGDGCGDKTVLLLLILFCFGPHRTDWVLVESLNTLEGEPRYLKHTLLSPVTRANSYQA